MNWNQYIDHTNLKMDATVKEIEVLCEEAKKNHFAAVVVAPYYVTLATNLLANTQVEVATVIGFPFGYQTTAAKVYEAIDAIENGATEIDFVINVSALKNHDLEYVKQEIEEVRDAIDGHTLKVIIETCLLTQEEIIEMTKLCNETFVHFIKTSTGFGQGGAKVEEVKLIAEHKNEVLEIKASGGIQTLEEVEAMVAAGATRIGTSHAMEMIGGMKK